MSNSPAALLAATLNTLWPHGDQHVPGLRAGMIAASPVVFPKYGITSRLVLAHLMAQFSEETGAGLEMIENDNFTAAQLVRLWPSHFTGSMAERLAHNERQICDVAYGGRMGNAPPPSDDGYNYRGKGLSQLTGKANYEALAKVTGLDVVNDPGLLIAPATALECGVADFVRICGCLPYAQRDDVRGVTLKLNGGYNGLAVREQWLARWKAALAAADRAPLPEPAAAPTAADAPGVAAESTFATIDRPAPPNAGTSGRSLSNDILVALRDMLAEINTRLHTA